MCFLIFIQIHTYVFVSLSIILHCPTYSYYICIFKICICLSIVHDVGYRYLQYICKKKSMIRLFVLDYSCTKSRQFGHTRLHIFQPKSEENHINGQCQSLPVARPCVLSMCLIIHAFPMKDIDSLDCPATLVTTSE